MSISLHLIAAAPATVDTLIEGLQGIAIRVPSAGTASARFSIEGVLVRVSSSDDDDREFDARTWGIVSTCRTTLRVSGAVIAVTRALSAATHADMVMVWNGETLLARRLHAAWELWSSFSDYFAWSADELTLAFGAFKRKEGEPFGLH